ncbi:MAG TPA: hypothetical protein VJ883_10680, partial [Woeseiaceae bacterium]|nr:hypothetical protein [Woeseiaceae bacterium]
MPIEMDDLAAAAAWSDTNFSLGLRSGGNLPADMDLRQRSNLVHLEQQLHGEWGLGQNCILSWCIHEAGVLLLVVPHYAVAEYTAAPDAGEPPQWRVSERFIMDLIS